MDKPIKAWRKPTPVDCIQYDGMNIEAIRSFVGPDNFKVDGQVRPVIRVTKFGGDDPWHPLMVGDWVLAEPDGSGFYPCAGPVFNDLYTKES